MKEKIQSLEKNLKELRRADKEAYKMSIRGILEQSERKKFRR
jgi:hypothetical protein